MSGTSIESRQLMCLNNNIVYAGLVASIRSDDSLSRSALNNILLQSGDIEQNPGPALESIFYIFVCLTVLSGVGVGYYGFKNSVEFVINLTYESATTAAKEVAWEAVNATADNAAHVYSGLDVFTYHNLGFGLFGAPDLPPFVTHISPQAILSNDSAYTTVNGTTFYSGKPCEPLPKYHVKVFNYTNVTEIDDNSSLCLQQFYRDSEGLKNTKDIIYYCSDFRPPGASIFGVSAWIARWNCYRFLLGRESTSADSAFALVGWLVSIGCWAFLLRFFGLLNVLTGLFFVIAWGFIRYTGSVMWARMVEKAGELTHAKVTYAALNDNPALVWDVLARCWVWPTAFDWTKRGVVFLLGCMVGFGKWIIGAAKEVGSDSIPARPIVTSLFSGVKNALTAPPQEANFDDEFQDLASWFVETIDEAWRTNHASMSQPEDDNAISKHVAQFGTIANARRRLRPGFKQQPGCFALGRLDKVADTKEAVRFFARDEEGTTSFVPFIPPIGREVWLCAAWDSGSTTATITLRNRRATSNPVPVNVHLLSFLAYGNDPAELNSLDVIHLVPSEINKSRIDFVRHAKEKRRLDGNDDKTSTTTAVAEAIAHATAQAVRTASQAARSASSNARSIANKAKETIKTASRSASPALQKGLEELAKRFRKFKPDDMKQAMEGIFGDERKSRMVKKSGEFNASSNYSPGAADNSLLERLRGLDDSATRKFSDSVESPRASPTRAPTPKPAAKRSGRTTSPRSENVGGEEARNQSPGQSLVKRGRKKGGKASNGDTEGICAPKSVIAVLEHLANIVLKYCSVNKRQPAKVVRDLNGQHHSTAAKLEWLKKQGYCHLDPKEGQDPLDILDKTLKQSVCMKLKDPASTAFGGWNELFALTDYDNEIDPDAVAVIKTIKSEGDEHSLAALKNQDGSWTVDDNGHRYKTSMEALVSDGADFISITLEVPLDSVYALAPGERFRLVPADVSDDEEVRIAIFKAIQALIITCKNFAKNHRQASATVRTIAEDETPLRKIVQGICDIIKKNQLLNCFEIDECKEVKCRGACKKRVDILYNRILRHVVAETVNNKTLKSYIARDDSCPRDSDAIPFMAIALNDDTWHVLPRSPGEIKFREVYNGKTTEFDEEELRNTDDGGLVDDVMFCWVTNLKRECKSSPGIDVCCDECSQDIDHHSYGKVIRGCPLCMRTLIGKCTGLEADEPAHWNENIDPNSSRLTAFHCPDCAKSVVMQAEMSCDSPKCSAAEPKARSSASNQSTASSSSSAQSIQSPCDTSSDSDDEPEAQAPPPPAKCDKCKKSRGKHTFRNSFQTCTKCRSVLLGRCHGFGYRLTDAVPNNKADYVCPACSALAAPKPEPKRATPAPPAPTPKRPEPRDSNDSPAPAPAPATASTPTPAHARDRDSVSSERSVSASPAPGTAAKKPSDKKFKNHAPHPSTNCDGCNSPAHGHAFARSYRQCRECRKYRYGACHGEEYRKTRGGQSQNDDANYLCTNCLPADKKKTATKPVDKENPASFSQALCEFCDIRKLEHHHSSSWRKCKKCASFTFGTCHLGGLAPEKNSDEFECATCKNDTEAPAVAARRAQESCHKVCSDTVIPANYSESPNLGEPAPEDVKKEMKSSEKTHGLKEPADGKQDFRFSLRDSPTAALVPGENFLEITINDKMDKEAAKGISEQTANFHRGLLTRFHEHLKNSPKWHRLPLTRAITRFLLIQAKLRDWKPQTLHRNAAGLHGALASLHLYSDSKVGVLLGKDSYWTHMMKYWRTMSNQAQPHNQAAVLVNEIEIAITAAPKLETKAALVLMWSTAARFSDVINIRKKHLKWDPKKKTLMVTIQEGKMMKHVQPYTVETKIFNDTMIAVLNQHLASIKQEDHYLFPHSLSPRKDRLININNALKTVNAEYSTRAIRRGALQAMAVNGVKLETIMQYSGHKSKETCMRYLDWGRLCTNHNKAAKEAARHLHRASSQE